MKTSELRNLGPRSVEVLAAAGIDSAEDLERVGAVTAYRRVLAAGEAPSLNLLWAMEGALLDLDWRELTPEMKVALLDEVDSA